MNKASLGGPSGRTKPVIRSLLLLLAGLRLVRGVALFPLTRRTNSGAYLAMRQLHAATRGASTRLVARLLGRRLQPAASTATGVLGRLSLEEAKGLAAQIDRDGFVVFRERLDPRLCDELTTLARSTACRLTPAPEDGRNHVYDPLSPLATRYDLSERDLLKSAAVQQLLVDPTLRMVSAVYLKAAPVNDLVAMWWTVPHGEANSEAAQMFHYDLDRASFLKFFVYLTDVSMTTGPHVYVRGSHRTRPSPFFEDRRFSDQEVAFAFPAKDIVRLDGPVGTIIAVDTSGLHKGEHPVDGDRLVFQLEFAVSLFGADYERLSGGELPLARKRELAEAAWTYQRLLERG